MTPFKYDVFNGAPARRNPKRSAHSDRTGLPLGATKATTANFASGVFNVGSRVAQHWLPRHTWTVPGLHTISQVSSRGNKETVDLRNCDLRRERMALLRLLQYTFGLADTARLTNECARTPTCAVARPPSIQTSSRQFMTNRCASTHFWENQPAPEFDWCFATNHSSSADFPTSVG